MKNLIISEIFVHFKKKFNLIFVTVKAKKIFNHYYQFDLYY